MKPLLFLTPYIGDRSYTKLKRELNDCSALFIIHYLGGGGTMR